jgi:pimeloyl-ACP methyl ester carboxylesterase
MSEVTHRTIETNGIRMHIAEQGEGPLVLLCHGFPESWYSTSYDRNERHCRPLLELRLYASY